MSTRITSLQEVAGGYAHIYLSPHPDDAALSCGGAIARHISSGQRVLVVTLCTAAPPSGALFNALAQELHSAYGAAGQDAAALRLHEDAIAMELLGADYLWLDFLDAIYRMPDAYTSDAALFGSLAPYDLLAVRLAALLVDLHQRCPDATLYAPLGVGHHVDHQATFYAAEALTLLGRSVAFYEDFPYALVANSVERRLASLGGKFVANTLDIDSTLARKISSVDVYASQVARLFGSSGAMIRAVIEYAEGMRPDQGTYGERLWLRLAEER